MLGVIRRVPANRKILPNRRSSWLNRLSYSEPGATTSTVVFCALPERLRPSDGAITEFGYTTDAVTSGPGRFWYAAAICTSNRGTVYVPSSFTCVRNGCSWWQYGIASEPLIGSRLSWL